MIFFSQFQSLHTKYTLIPHTGKWKKQHKTDFYPLKVNIGTIQSLFLWLHLLRTCLDAFCHFKNANICDSEIIVQI